MNVIEFNVEKILGTIINKLREKKRVQKILRTECVHMLRPLSRYKPPHRISNFQTVNSLPAV